MAVDDHRNERRLQRQAPFGGLHGSEPFRFGIDDLDAEVLMSRVRRHQPRPNRRFDGA